MVCTHLLIKKEAILVKYRIQAQEPINSSKATQRESLFQASKENSISKYHQDLVRMKSEMKYKDLAVLSIIIFIKESAKV